MPQIACKACPLRKCEIFTPFSDDEVGFTQKFKAGELTVDAGSTLLMEGSNSPQLFTVLQGMGTRAKTLPNGRRQVINFIMPGDFIGLQAGLLGEMKHSVEASSNMRLCVFNRSDFWKVFQSHPERAYDITWIAAVEEHFLGETIASIGQRDATQRLAWALLRLFQRLKAVGLADGSSVPLPFRQQDIADALGLSLVHTNKTLSRLRERQLVNWSDGTLQIHDPQALADIALVEYEEPPRRPLI